MSRTLRPGKHGEVTVLGADALERVAELRSQPGKDIWLWGGGELFGSLAAAGLVDTTSRTHRREMACPSRSTLDGRASFGGGP